MKRQIIGLLGVIALGWALSIGGCGKSGSKPTQYSIAGIVFQDDEFMHLVHAGMRSAAKQANAELVEGNTNNKQEKEYQLINTYAAQGLDAIIITPLSKTGSIAALKLAHEKGIPVITFNTTIDSDIVSSYIESSQPDLGEQTGKAAREYIEKKLGGKAKVAILQFRTFLPEMSDARVQGFKDQIKDMPGVQIVNEQEAWLPDKGMIRASDILTANPDVNVIFCANEGGTVGAVLAVRKAGKAGKVAVFGIDVSNQLIDMLKDQENILQAVTGQRPFEIGQLSMQTALKVIKKEPVEKRVFLKGTCLSRSDSQAIQDYEKKLRQWLGKE